MVKIPTATKAKKMEETAKGTPNHGCPKWKPRTKAQDRPAAATGLPNPTNGKDDSEELVGLAGSLGVARFDERSH